MNPITSFKGSYRYLSNFYIEPDGTHVEGEYQTEKCKDSSERILFEGLLPAEAKKFGRTVELRPDWEEIKLTVMRGLVLRKFKDHPVLAEKLVKTGGVEIVEGNYWGDKFWGKVFGGQGEGQNWLGRILMETRDKLRNV